MRKLVYDCYYENIHLVTALTLEAANAWKSISRYNTYKVSLVDCPDVTRKAKEWFKKHAEKVEEKRESNAVYGW